MARFGVSVEKERELKRQMQAMGILEGDIEESFIRSSGPGGQNVNKVASCVYLKHLPTNIEIKCQEERNQSLNRYRARCLLMEKVARLRYEQKLQKIQEVEKIRRQRRKRTKAMKEGILEQKHKRSEKKQFRNKVQPHQLGD